MRLNRYLSLCGLGSRRGVEDLVKEGRVSINGSFCRTLGITVEEGDEVKVDGRIVRPHKGVVIALHKPKGYLCTAEDTHKRATIYDLLPIKFESLHHVGRLDKESEGLLLMTNRGDLSQRLMHPSEGVEKEYDVIVDKPLQASVFAKLVKGMPTEEGFAKAERAFAGPSEYRVTIVLKQGLKRQIRHMMYALGYEVERLIRVRIGWLSLRGIAKGGWRELTDAEVDRFFSQEKGGMVKPRKRVRQVSKKLAEGPDAAAKKMLPAAKRKPAAKRAEAGRQGASEERKAVRKSVGGAKRRLEEREFEQGKPVRKSAGGGRTGGKRSEGKGAPGKRTGGGGRPSAGGRRSNRD